MFINSNFYLPFSDLSTQWKQTCSNSLLAERVTNPGGLMAVTKFSLVYLAALAALVTLHYHPYPLTPVLYRYPNHKNRRLCIRESLCGENPAHREQSSASYLEITFLAQTFYCCLFTLPIWPSANPSFYSHSCSLLFSTFDIYQMTPLYPPLPMDQEMWPGVHGHLVDLWRVFW